MKDEEVVALVRSEVEKAMSAAGRVRVVPASQVIRHEYQQRAVERVVEKTSGWPRDDYEVLRFALSQDAPISAARFTQVAFGHSSGTVVKRYADALARLLKFGVVEKTGGGGHGVPVSYKPCLRDWVAAELAPHDPADAEIEDVYQTVIGRIAGSPP